MPFRETIKYLVGNTFLFDCLELLKRFVYKKMPHHPIPLCNCGSCEKVGYIVMINRHTSDMYLECEIFHCQVSQYKNTNTSPRGYFSLWCSDITNDVKRR